MAGPYGTLRADKLEWWDPSLDGGNGDNRTHTLDDIALKATVDGQTFTGNVVLPGTTTGVTQTAGDNSTKLATTEYVDLAPDPTLQTVLATGSTASYGVELSANMGSPGGGKMILGNNGNIKLYDQANTLNTEFGSDGSATFAGDVTVGVDGTGHDVKFFGASAGKYCLWDESADELTVDGSLQVDSGPFYANCQANFYEDVHFVRSGGTPISVSSGTGFHQTVGNIGSQPVLMLDYDGCDLYYQGDKKLETTTDGVTVTGKVTTSGIDSNGQYNIKPGGEFFKFENTSAWHLTYDDSGSGSGWSYAIDATKNYVRLYGPGGSGSTIVLETKTGGVDVTGDLDVSGTLTCTDMDGDIDCGVYAS